MPLISMKKKYKIHVFDVFFDGNVEYEVRLILSFIVISLIINIRILFFQFFKFERPKKVVTKVSGIVSKCRYYILNRMRQCHVHKRVPIVGNVYKTVTDFLSFFCRDFLIYIFQKLCIGVTTSLILQYSTVLQKKLSALQFSSLKILLKVIGYYFLRTLTYKCTKNILQNFCFRFFQHNTLQISFISLNHCYENDYVNNKISAHTILSIN